MARYHSEETRLKCLKALETGQFSISEVSKRYGVSRHTISAWATGKRGTRQKEDKSHLWQAIEGVAPQSAAPSFSLTHKPADIAHGVGLNIAAVGDMQVKPDIDLSYCTWNGKYLAEKRPDVILLGGDFADMPSLSTYDQPGSKGMEGARYKEDILSAHAAMKMLMEPIERERQRSGWNPRLIALMGNHEDRIRRAIEATPKLDGVIGFPDLPYEQHGFEVIPFLEPIILQNIAFAHYFCSGVMGRPITTARALLQKKHMSCVAFHQQGRDIAFGQRADGGDMIGLIAGSNYPHEENYLNKQTNNHWRGFYMLNDCVDGSFEDRAVSMKHLQRKYGA